MSHVARLNLFRSGAARKNGKVSCCFLEVARLILEERDWKLISSIVGDSMWDYNRRDAAGC